MPYEWLQTFLFIPRVTTRVPSLSLLHVVLFPPQFGPLDESDMILAVYLIWAGKKDKLLLADSFWQGVCLELCGGKGVGCGVCRFEVMIVLVVSGCGRVGEG